MGKTHRVGVKVKGSSHYIKVIDITATTATISVSSTPQEAELGIGEEKKFDVTNDGYYDLSVKLNSIENSKIDLTIEAVEEEKEMTLEKKKELGLSPPDELEETKSYFGYIIGLVLVIIVIVVFFIIKKYKLLKFKK